MQEAKDLIARLLAKRLSRLDPLNPHGGNDSFSQFQLVSASFSQFQPVMVPFSCTVRNPSERMTLEEVLAHPWIALNCTGTLAASRL